jgi:hypothetical protein
MKKAFVILIAASALLISCDDGNSMMSSLSFDVQSSFDNDHVIIKVDGHEVLDKNVTTNHILGVDVDARATVAVRQGKHDVYIIINGTEQLETSVTTTGDLYIGVRFDPESNQLSITESSEPFMYD